METQIIEIAERIRTLRDIMGFSLEEMAAGTGVSVQEYSEMEEGKSDFSFTFLYKCAEMFGVDIVEILTGDGPKELLIAPLWSSRKRSVLNEIHRQLKLRGSWQGKSFLS